MNTPLRVLLFILLVAYVIWHVRNRWQSASHVSEADEAAMKAWKMGFQQFKTDPRFQTIKAYIDGKYQNTFDKPTDDTTFQILYMTPMDGKGQTYEFGAMDQATALVAYAKNKQKRLQISMDLKTNQVYENELGSMAFSSVVPHWAGN